VAPNTVVPISVRLREEREAKGWSRQTLAEKSGISVTTIAEIELDRRTRGPRFSTLVVLADALGLVVKLSK
jgi:transcriptional regulator with XRE-family HTH domain